MAMNRVIPPSTISSYTMSAWSSPVWGLESGEFSLLTATAGRAMSRPFGGSSPVSGQIGGTSSCGAAASGSASGSGSSLVQAPTNRRVASSAPKSATRLPVEFKGSLHFAPGVGNEVNPDGSRSQHHVVALPGLEDHGVVHIVALPRAADRSPVPEESRPARACFVCDLDRWRSGDVDDLAEIHGVFFDDHVLDSYLTVALGLERSSSLRARVAFAVELVGHGSRRREVDRHIASRPGAPVVIDAPEVELGSRGLAELLLADPPEPSTVAVERVLRCESLTRDPLHRVPRIGLVHPNDVVLIKVAHHGLVAAGESEDSRCRQHDRDVDQARAANRTRLGSVPAVIDGHEAGDAPLDEFLVHDVGVLETRQRVRDGRVLDLDGNRRTVEKVLVSWFLTGEGALRRSKCSTDDRYVFFVGKGNVDTTRHKHHYDADDCGLYLRGKPARPPCITFD